MQALDSPRPPKQQLARLARERWLAHLQSGLPKIDQEVEAFLHALMQRTGTHHDMSVRRDAWQVFGQKRIRWLEATGRSFSEAASRVLASTFPSARSNPVSKLDQLELVGDEVVENKIIASRIAMTVMETVAPALYALRIRLKALGEPDWQERDLLRPETVSLILVECWLKVGLARDDLQLCNEALQRATTVVVQAGYDECNRFLAEHGVSAERELRVSVRDTSPVMGGAGSSSAHVSAGGMASQAFEAPQRFVQSQGYGGMPAASVRGGLDIMRPADVGPVSGDFSRGPAATGRWAERTGASGFGGYFTHEPAASRRRSRRRRSPWLRCGRALRPR